MLLESILIKFISISDIYFATDIELIKDKKRNLHVFASFFPDEGVLIAVFQCELFIRYSSKLCDMFHKLFNKNSYLQVLASFFTGDKLLIAAIQCKN